MTLIDPQEQLNSFAAQRDALLLEVSTLKTEQEGLTKKNKELAVSNTEIEQRVNQAIGRIKELQDREADLLASISKEVSLLQNEKNLLEVTVSTLKKEVEALSAQEEKLKVSLSCMTDIFDKIQGRSEVLDKVVNYVIGVNEKNVKVIDTMVEGLKTKVNELIDISDKNIEKTNNVITELPKVFVEVQRQSLERNIIKKVKK